jgi:hypothetical protein
MTRDRHQKKEQADLEAKVSEAKSAVDSGNASAREQAMHPPKKAASGSVDGKLDRALEDSFPSSDPVSFVQAAPVKKADESLKTIPEGNKNKD